MARPTLEQMIEACGTASTKMFADHRRQALEAAADLLRRLDPGKPDNAARVHKAAFDQGTFLNLPTARAILRAITEIG